MKHGLVAALFLGLTVASTAAMTGCCGGKKGGTAVLGTTGELVTIANAGLKFNIPGGWFAQPAGDWKLYKTPDNAARLGFVTFDKPNESTRRIGEISTALGLVISGGDWRPTNDKAIGPHQLRLSTSGETPAGSCKTAKTNEDCYTWYATVDSGRSTQLLIVYAVTNSSKAKHLPNVQAAVQSLSKM